MGQVLGVDRFGVFKWLKAGCRAPEFVGGLTVRAFIALWCAEGTGFTLFWGFGAVFLGSVIWGRLASGLVGLGFKRFGV